MQKEIRICNRHGPMVHYFAIERASGYSRWRCRRCSGEAVLKRKQLMRRILIAQGGDRCQACRYNRCLKNLHFHHVDPTQKEFEISSGNGKSLARFQEEAKKCVLVCANCHGEIEAGVRKSPPTMEDRVRALREAPLTYDDVLRMPRH